MENAKKSNLDKNSTNLLELKDNFLKYSKLITKFKNYNFLDPFQAQIAIEYIQRYQQLEQIFDNLNLPEPKILPINYNIKYNDEV